jgi:hypothetical protein
MKIQSYEKIALVDHATFADDSSICTHLKAKEIVMIAALVTMFALSAPAQCVGGTCFGPPSGRFSGSFSAGGGSGIYPGGYVMEPSWGGGYPIGGGYGGGYGGYGGYGGQVFRDRTYIYSRDYSGPQSFYGGGQPIYAQPYSGFGGYSGGYSGWGGMYPSSRWVIRRW